MIRKVIAKKRGEEVYLCETSVGFYQVVDCVKGKRLRPLGRAALDIRGEPWVLMKETPPGLIDRLSSFPQA